MRNLTCVLIDEDIEDIEFFNIALKDSILPLTIHSYTNIEEAIKELSDIENIPDCIFLELRMSGLQSDYLERIKQCVNDKSSLVILSSYQHSKFINSEAVHYISKTNTIEELRNSLLLFFESKFNISIKKSYKSKGKPL